jgi:hypothetical protein
MLSAGLWGIIFLSLILIVLPSCKKSDEAKSEGGASTAAESKKSSENFDTWTLFTSEESGFSILTPRTFSKTIDKTPTEAGEISYTQFMAQPNYRHIYIVVTSDMPENLIAGKDPQKLLEGGREGVVNQFQGTVTQEKAISLDGNPGLESIMTGATQGMNVLVKVRFYLVKNRLYQVYAMAEKGYEDMVAFDKYLDSFKLK